MLRKKKQHDEMEGISKNMQPSPMNVSSALGTEGDGDGEEGDGDGGTDAAGLGGSGLEIVAGGGRDGKVDGKVDVGAEEKDGKDVRLGEGKVVDGMEGVEDSLWET